MGKLPKTVVWALAASAAVHSAVVLLPMASRGQQPGTVADRGTALKAALLSPSLPKAEPKAEPEAEPEADRTSVLAASSSSSPTPVLKQVRTTAPESHSNPLPPPPPSPDITAPSPRLSIGDAADFQVYAHPLDDRDRLGELLARQMSEFPMEVDFPVRLKEALRARYPPTALAEGREDSVAVWIVVGADGTPEEVTVTEGTEEFADAVVAAVMSAQFLPARNKLAPVRFPLALEFRFAINAPALAGVQPTIK